jgi:hypothetical protein
MHAFTEVQQMYKVKKERSLVDIKRKDIATSKSYTRKCPTVRLKAVASNLRSHVAVLAGRS